MKNKSSAFSLIELSIVILIIGVLIAGVTQASRVVRHSKITTAQTLSQSSPMNSLRGLVLWLEPTMELSFQDSQEIDGEALTKWYDANPQRTIANTFTASTGITYKATSATNALPAVSFADGNTSFAGTVIDAPFSAYTIFYVVRSTNLAAENTVLYDGVSGSTGFGISLTGTNGGLTKFSYGTASSFDFGMSAAVSKQGKADIVSITVAPNSVLGASVANPIVLSYKNGVAASQQTTATAQWVLPTTAMRIGNSVGSSSTTDFIGEISEVIVFDNVLKRSDREEIEKYLSKKYAIAIVQSGEAVIN